MADEFYFKTIELPQNRRFYFSSRYDRETMDPLLTEAWIQARIIVEFPLPHNRFISNKKKYRADSIFGTAALEGNPLSLEEVNVILTDANNREAKNKAEQEIINLGKADALLESMLPSKKEKYLLTEETILLFHRTIMEGIDEAESRPGEYRRTAVKVGDKDHGGTYVPPRHFKEIQSLMREFISFINSDIVLTGNPIVRAGLAHFHLGLIHPFEDGNGRTARFIEALLLKAEKLSFFPSMLFNYYNDRKDDYYWAFSLARNNDDHDITKFLALMIEGIIDRFTHIKEDVKFVIVLLALRDYLRFLRSDKSINARQYDLMNLLLHSFDSITPVGIRQNPPYNVLYRDVSEKTAKRDLSGLYNLNLLLKKEDGKYAINMGALNIE